MAIITIEHSLDIIYELQNAEYFKKANHEPGRRYISINFTSIPIQKEKPIIDLNNKDTKSFINKMLKKGVVLNREGRDYHNLSDLYRSLIQIFLGF